MKQLRFLQTLFFGSALSFLFFSCNSGSTNTEEKTMTDSTTADTSAAMSASTPAPSAYPANVLIIKQKVINYDKWKPSYDSHDSIRTANGLHNYVVGRGIDDPNTVVVILRADDVNKAKAFMASPELKERMKKAGVTGAPEMDLLNVAMNDTTNIDQKMRLMVKHKVKDWDAWKKSFDSHKQVRMDAGLIDRGLGYGVDDNHLVSIVFAVTDKKKADDFSKSKDLKDKMAEAGVDGPPSFFYYNIVQKN